MATELPDDPEFGDEDSDEDETALPPRYSITAYGADYPIDGLVKRLGTGAISIPKFQRGYVWNLSQASRFIESLLHGLPVPGIFLSRDTDAERLIVIDGQQRLRTIEYFYKGIFHNRRAFALKGVQNTYANKTYDQLLDTDARRLDDTTIHATIVQQDDPDDDNSSVYHIFERLNTGGTRLYPHEIRAAIYHGAFIDLLSKMNRNRYWRRLFGKVSQRMRDQELILRFLALYFESDNYESPMKGFLNGFLRRNRSLRKYSNEDIESIFRQSMKVAYTSIGKRAFRPRRAINAAVFDAVMVGMARRIRNGQAPDKDSIREAYDALLANDDFLRAIETGTSHEASVKRRIDLAVRYFAES